MFAHDLAAALPELRVLAESRMTSRCNILRRTGRLLQNEGTGDEYPEWWPIHVDLPMRLDDMRGGLIEIAGVQFPDATGIGHWPALTADLEDGDWFDITIGENASFVGSIAKVLRADQKTARRLPIKEEQRPEEWGF